MWILHIVLIFVVDFIIAYLGQSFRLCNADILKWSINDREAVLFGSMIASIFFSIVYGLING